MTTDGTPLLADRYLMHRRIAVGDSGEIWRATDVMLSRTVAVKILRPELAADAEAVVRFRDKARLAGSVPGGGIIRVYDYDETCSASPPFLVMEYIDGRSLDEILTAGPLTPDRTMSIAAQIARTLQDAQRAGMEHPDIRPENVVIGRNDLVKLTDFGKSRFGATAPMTETGAELADASYLAPERVSGAHGNAAGDLYALGILVYQCLMGTLPFTGTPVEVAVAHRTSAVPPLPGSFPPEVAMLVGELTAKDAAARPGSAGEVSRRAAAIRDRMVTVQPPPPRDTRPFPVPDQIDPASPMSAVSLPPTYPRHSRQRQVVLPTVAVAAIALALVLGHIIDPVRPAAKAPASVTLVNVSGTALRGRLVTVVKVQLRKLGLTVSVRWAISSAVPPGRVVSVSPAGHLPQGTLITVTGALPPTQAQRQPARPSVASAPARSAKPARHPATASPAASSPPTSSSPSPGSTTSSPDPSSSPNPGPSATSAPSGGPSPGPT
jgi:serine/threonine-protein kinase